MTLLLFALLCFVTFLVFSTGCSPVQLKKPHSQSYNSHSNISLYVRFARREAADALKDVQLLGKTGGIENSKAKQFPSCDTLVQMLDALNCTTDNIALTEAAFSLVNVLLVSLANLTSPVEWAVLVHRTSVHLNHASSVLEAVHRRLQVRRANRIRQQHRGRPSPRTEQIRIQRLNHTAPQLEPKCLLREHPKLVFQLEVAIDRLVKSMAVLSENI